MLKVLKQRCKPIVWDQFRAHKTEKVKEKLKALKTTQAMIPGGLTSVLQPLDVVINKPFKDRLRQKWVEWMSSDDKPLTKGGNLKKPALALVTSWVKSAWYDLPQEMVKKSFLKTLMRTCLQNNGMNCLVTAQMRVTLMGITVDVVFGFNK